MEYVITKFKDIYPKWKDVALDDLTEKLCGFIDTHANNHPKCAIIVEINHEDAAAIPHVKKAKFALYYANNDKSVWVYKNDAMLPPIYYGYAGIQIYCKKDDKLLMIEEKYKVGWGPIAGAAEDNEFPRDAACRELSEEVGLAANPDTIKLFCSRIRRRANAVKAINYDYYFICEDFKGEIKINPNEVLRFAWIPISQLATETTIDGLNVSPILKEIANYLMNNNKTYFKKMIDCRQWNAEKKDESDVLHLEFIQNSFE